MRHPQAHPRPSRVLWSAVLLMVHGLCAAADPSGSAPVPLPGPEAIVEDAEAGDVFALERARTSVTDPALAAIARARIAAARLRAAEATSIARAVASDAATSPDQQSRAWAVLADASFTAGDYADAATAVEGWSAALQQRKAPRKDIDDAQRMGALAFALSSAPPQRMESLAPRTAPVRTDKVGLSRADANVNGHSQEAVLDTGAGLSVVSQSTATRLGLRMLEREATIGSAARDAVPTRIGVAEKFEFAGLALRNVAFLVLDDKQLELPVPGGYRIDAIIGFPVLREFKRIRFDRSGSMTPEPDATPQSPTENLRIVGNSLYVDARFRGIPVAMHLDSGGSRSSLSSRFSHRHPHLVEGLATTDERLAGAGGATTRRSAVMREATLEVAGRTATLPELSIVVEDGGDVEAENFGLLGGDVLNQFDWWALDFEAMTFELGPALR